MQTNNTIMEKCKIFWWECTKPQECFVNSGRWIEILSNISLANDREPDEDDIDIWHWDLHYDVLMDSHPDRKKIESKSKDDMNRVIQELQIDRKRIKQQLDGELVIVREKFNRAFACAMNKLSKNT